MEKKILLIEDNIDVRETTAAILELARYEVVTAQNGKEGAEMAIQEKPDLIICDIMMPVLDGYGVLHLLSRNDETASIPFIFLTARAERNDIRKGMDLGADDYITKPFDDSELLSAIESRLRKTDMLKKDFTGPDGLDAFMEDIREFSDLQQHRESKYYRKRDIIYREGEFPKGIYFLKSGKVKTFRTNEQGKELITGLYREGDFFGYLALAEDGKYNDSAMASEEVEVSMLPKEDFFTLIYRNPQIAKKFIQLISSNFEEKEQQLLKLAYNSVRKRVAESLVKMWDHYKETSREKGVTVSREDLANLAGTATETTIRTLSDFRQEGLIEINGGMITILRYDQLQRMKN